jgi:hypothetical protein
MGGSDLRTLIHIGRLSVHAITSTPSLLIKGSRISRQSPPMNPMKGKRIYLIANQGRLWRAADT